MLFAKHPAIVLVEQMFFINNLAFDQEFGSRFIFPQQK